MIILILTVKMKLETTCFLVSISFSKFYNKAIVLDSMCDQMVKISLLSSLLHIYDVFENMAEAPKSLYYCVASLLQIICSIL